MSTDFPTKDKAEETGRLLLNLFPRGWKLIVSENLGWHIKYFKGCVAVYPDIEKGRVTWHCMIPGLGRHCGSGGGLWTGFGHAKYKLPMNAVRAALRAAKAAVDTYVQHLAQIEAELGNLKNDQGPIHETARRAPVPNRPRQSLEHPGRKPRGGDRRRGSSRRSVQHVS